jgi:uncharacterized membrane-anchored protein
MQSIPWKFKACFFVCCLKGYNESFCFFGVGMSVHRLFKQALWALLWVLGFSGSVVYAENEATQKEIAEAQAAALSMMKSGPAEIPFQDQAVFKLPEGYGFIPKEAAVRLMKAVGSEQGDGFLGLIVGDHMSGMVLVSYHNTGYIKDEEAKHWKTEEMLTQIKEGTLEQNKERVSLGLPQINVTGWVEEPKYDATTHRLVWSVGVKQLESTANESSVNYNTFVLGREGFMTLNLVTGSAEVEKEKSNAQALLAAVSFNDGKRYENFNEDTDKVAEYGLAALIGGLAAKKLGLLAALGVFLLKIWKVVALVCVGGLVALKQKFSKQKPSA